MNKEELIGKLQMVYVGDRNALNELIGYYDGLKEVIEIVQEENKRLKEEYMLLTNASEQYEDELQERIDKVIEYLKRKQNEPEWWDTDFMICIDILNGGSGNLKDRLGGDVDDE